MIAKIWKELLILIAIFGAIWAFFSIKNYEVKKNPFAISLENEEKLAEFLDEHMLDIVLLENDSLQDSLQLIMDRLITNMDTVTYDYQLHIVDDAQVNAFTTLNGNIYVLKGLIENLESAEELAVIIAHEIGHAENQHVVEKIIKIVGIEAMFSILSGGDPVLLSEVAKLAVSTSFDRANEDEADDYALELSYKSNINPRRLGQFFLRLKSQKSSVLDDVEFIRTHPLDSDRIKKSSDFEVPEDFEEIPIGLNWSNMKRMASRR